jgi:hypothetical protein
MHGWREKEAEKEGEVHARLEGEGGREGGRGTCMVGGRRRLRMKVSISNNPSIVTFNSLNI